MFSTLRGFLNRHRRKFIIGGLVIGGFILVTRYSQRKVREWREDEVRDLLRRTRRSQHFESTERSCNQTILNLAACLRSSVTKALNTESVVDRLRNGCQDKLATWEELKILAISRSAVIIYSNTMLVATLRVQLNLMGGRMFKYSQNPQDGASLDEEVQHEYLTLCSYLMEEGIEKLSRFIREKVEEITASISLKDKLTLRDLEQIYWSVMSSVSADFTRDPVKNITSYMLPANFDRDKKPALARMIDETLDLLESDEVRNLIQSTIRSGFVLLIDHVSEYFVDSSIAGRNGDNVPASSRPVGGRSSAISEKDNSPDTCFPNGYTNFNKITMPVAKIIPIINGQVRDVSTPGDIASDWLQANIANDKLKTLGANIYEAFSF